MRNDSIVTVAQIGDFEDVIDARSPAEYALDHLPGAVNFPVLDNEERATVGTLYASSPFEARKLGAALVARNIARHLEESFAARPPAWRPLVYCWRGGKRSGSMALIMREIGWRAMTLQGGYQAWRRAVVAELQTLPLQLEFRVVCGPTGSGKSVLLRELAAQGAQVLDLEGLARHRGSVLGGLPDELQPTQKAFETGLYQALRGFRPDAPVFVESESRRIGSIHLPTPLLERMRAAPCLRVEPPLAERVSFLIDEYRHFTQHPQLLRERLEQLATLQPRSVIAHWMACVEAGDWTALTTDLLEAHYDPLYRRSMARNYPGSDAEVLRPESLSSPALAASAAQVLQSVHAVAA
jgi:tRNA 2-selenouridine synthase